MRFIFCLLLLLNLAFSKDFEIKKLPANYYKFDEHFANASKKYNIPFILLKGIALTENTPLKSKTTNKNTNKTTDYGLMQINTIFLNKFNISEKEILDPSVNIDTAARIIRDIVDKHGYSWSSVGRYHSATDKFKKKWIKKVKTSIAAIQKLDPKLSTVDFLKNSYHVVELDTEGFKRVKRKAIFVDIKPL